MNKITVKFQRLAHANDLKLPSYATAGAVGIDIAAAIDRPRCLQPGTIMAIPTGFAMELPAGYEAQIRPRSGLALKHGVTIANAPGTIDSDYRGELKVIHRRYDTIEFEVLNTDGSFGVANCFSEINYAYQKASLKVNTKERLYFVTDSEEQSLYQGDIYNCNEDGNFFRDTTMSIQKAITEERQALQSTSERSKVQKVN